jgi:hypothetical protein
VSAAERLIDSLRDLLYTWTHRKPRQSAPDVPRIDLDELLERHEARLTPSRGARVQERVTMNDQAVSKLFDRSESVRSPYL